MGSRWMKGLALRHLEGRSESGSHQDLGRWAVGSRTDGRRKNQISMQPAAPTRLADKESAAELHVCMIMFYVVATYEQ